MTEQQVVLDLGASGMLDSDFSRKENFTWKDLIYMAVKIALDSNDDLAHYTQAIDNLGNLVWDELDEKARDFYDSNKKGSYFEQLVAEWGETKRLEALYQASRQKFSFILEHIKKKKLFEEDENSWQQLINISVLAVLRGSKDFAAYLRAMGNLELLLSADLSVDYPNDIAKEETRLKREHGETEREKISIGTASFRFRELVKASKKRVPVEAEWTI